jgi:integrase
VIVGHGGTPLAKRNKRGNGEGSVFQRKDGRWVAACTIDGKQRLKYARTRAEASKLLTEMVSSVHKGLPVPTGNQTVAQFLTQWLHDVVGRDVKPSTYVVHDQLLSLHAVPAIGKHMLTKGDAAARASSLLSDDGSATTWG